METVQDSFQLQQTARSRGVKQERAKYSRTHLEILNYIFARQRYPTIGQQNVLAQRLGLKSQQIKFWFQNRRRKESSNKGPIQFPTGCVEEHVLASMYKEMMRGGACGSKDSRRSTPEPIKSEESMGSVARDVQGNGQYQPPTVDLNIFQNQFSQFGNPLNFMPGNSAMMQPRFHVDNEQNSSPLDFSHPEKYVANYSSPLNFGENGNFSPHSHDLSNHSSASGQNPEDKSDCDEPIYTTLESRPRSLNGNSDGSMNPEAVRMSSFRREFSGMDSLGMGHRPQMVSYARFHNDQPVFPDPRMMKVGMHNPATKTHCGTPRDTDSGTQLRVHGEINSMSEGPPDMPDTRHDLEVDGKKYSPSYSRNQGTFSDNRVGPAYGASDLIDPHDDQYQSDSISANKEKIREKSLMNQNYFDIAVSTCADGDVCCVLQSDGSDDCVSSSEESTNVPSVEQKDNHESVFSDDLDEASDKNSETLSVRLKGTGGPCSLAASNADSTVSPPEYRPRPPYPQGTPLPEVGLLEGGYPIRIPHPSHQGHLKTTAAIPPYLRPRYNDHMVITSEYDEDPQNKDKPPDEPNDEHIDSPFDLRGPLHPRLRPDSPFDPSYPPPRSFNRRQMGSRFLLTNPAACNLRKPRTMDNRPIMMKMNDLRQYTMRLPTEGHRLMQCPDLPRISEPVENATFADTEGVDGKKIGSSYSTAAYTANAEYEEKCSSESSKCSSESSSVSQPRWSTESETQGEQGQQLPASGSDYSPLSCPDAGLPGLDSRFPNPGPRFHGPDPHSRFLCSDLRFFGPDPRFTGPDLRFTSPEPRFNSQDPRFPGPRFGLPVVLETRTKMENEEMAQDFNHRRLPLTEGIDSKMEYAVLGMKPRVLGMDDRTAYQRLPRHNHNPRVSAILGSMELIDHGSQIRTPHEEEFRTPFMGLRMHPEVDSKMPGRDSAGSTDGLDVDRQTENTPDIKIRFNRDTRVHVGDDSKPVSCDPKLPSDVDSSQEFDDLTVQSGDDSRMSAIGDTAMMGTRFEEQLSRVNVGQVSQEPSHLRHHLTNQHQACSLRASPSPQGDKSSLDSAKSVDSGGSTSCNADILRHMAAQSSMNTSKPEANSDKEFYCATIAVDDRAKDTPENNSKFPLRKQSALVPPFYHSLQGQESLQPGGKCDSPVKSSQKNMGTDFMRFSHSMILNPMLMASVGVPGHPMEGLRTPEGPIMSNPYMVHPFMLQGVLGSASPMIRDPLQGIHIGDQIGDPSRGPPFQAGISGNGPGPGVAGPGTTMGLPASVAGLRHSFSGVHASFQGMHGISGIQVGLPGSISLPMMIPHLTSESEPRKMASQ